jgi:hypothetical protein
LYIHSWRDGLWHKNRISSNAGDRWKCGEKPEDWIMGGVSILDYIDVTQ